MPCSTSGKSFNSYRQTISIMARQWINKEKWFQDSSWALLVWRCGGNSTFVTVNGGSKDESLFSLLFFTPTFHSWNKIGLAKPARIFGTCTEIISPIISGKLTLVGSDWAWTKRSNVNWWSFFTVWNKRKHTQWKRHHLNTSCSYMQFQQWHMKLDSGKNTRCTQHMLPP